MSACDSVTVMGLDLSLTSSGVAHVANGKVLDVARFTSTGHDGATVAFTSERIELMAEEILAWCDGPSIDLAVVEAPSFASKFGKPHERAGLWWEVVKGFVHWEVPVATVSPQGRAKYGTGKGNAKKPAVEAAVRASYLDVQWPARGKADDIADAVILAAMGARVLGQPIDPWVDSKPAQLAAIAGMNTPEEVKAA